MMNRQGKLVYQLLVEQHKTRNQMQRERRKQAKPSRPETEERDDR